MPEAETSAFLRNVDKFLQGYTVPCPNNNNIGENLYPKGRYLYEISACLPPECEEDTSLFSLRRARYIREVNKLQYLAKNARTAPEMPICINRDNSVRCCVSCILSVECRSNQVGNVRVRQHFILTIVAIKTQQSLRCVLLSYC